LAHTYPELEVLLEVLLELDDAPPVPGSEVELVEEQLVATTIADTAAPTERAPIRRSIDAAGTDMAVPRAFGMPAPERALRPGFHRGGAPGVCQTGQTRAYAS
jgi:hypothetical protein